MGTLKDLQIRAWVRAGQPIAGKSDGDGLTFTQSKAGTAAWVLRYRHGGRARELTLGNFPDMTLDDARRAARAARAKVDAGVDVAGEKRRSRSDQAKAKTLREICVEYLERGALALRPRSRREMQRYLEKDIFPKLGQLLADEIRPQEIVTTIEAIAERSDSVARSAFEKLSVIFAHALARHSVRSNPCAGLRLNAILGPRPARRPRLMLSADELRASWRALPGLGRVNELCAKILLATCVRKGELVQAKREHVDLVARTWFVPDDNSKSGKGFLIPLAPAVAEWFRELLFLAGNGPWLLPSFNRRGRFEQRHMSDKTLNAALERLQVIGVREFTPHDLRSTARSHLAALGVDLIVAERCLNHSLGGLVAVYDQHDYLDERRRALELWARFLVDLTPDEQRNVVPLRTAA